MINFSFNFMKEICRNLIEIDLETKNDKSVLIMVLDGFACFYYIY